MEKKEEWNDIEVPNEEQKEVEFEIEEEEEVETKPEPEPEDRIDRMRKAGL